jgi:FtsP/CotA-like multicopper oxidase with cupredoxin domain
VYQRKYRFRYLDCSLSRRYVLEIRQGTPHPFPGLPGQWNFGAADGHGTVSRVAGTCVMLQTQIASDGGLLPTPVRREAIELWPSKRREVIVDFTSYRDGSPTRVGDVVYLTNTAFMPDGRRQTRDERYAVPLVRIVIGGPPPEPDHSVMPVPGKTPLRPAPPFDPRAARARDFTLVRGPGAGETDWLGGGTGLDPLPVLATPVLGSGEAWAIHNASDSNQAVHLHMEEHRVAWRSKGLAEHDAGKEDVLALEPGEQAVLHRRFRTFLGNYVARCHGIGRGDGGTMFGWTVVKSI